MGFGQILSKLVGADPIGQVDKLGKAVDEFVLTKEEKQNFILEQQKLEENASIRLAEERAEVRNNDLKKFEALIELEGKLEEIDASNTANARQRETLITNSASASRFQKEFPLYLAIFVFMNISFIAIYSLVNGVSEKNAVAFTSIKEFFFGSGTFIIGYYFGSSRGSSNKEELIKKIANEPGQKI